MHSFLDLIFPEDLREADPGEPVYWATPGGAPGYPVRFEALIRRLARSARPQAAYYGTCTILESTSMISGEPELRYRQADFSKLYVLVLDDVGTKVPVTKLPEAFRHPSYIIETSPDNFQYGLVLEEPLDDLQQAKLLVQMLYDSGLTDSGGAMPNKLVRLPVGVNGKRGKADFEVRLLHQSDVVYTPDDILKALSIRCDWADLAAGRVDPSEFMTVRPTAFFRARLPSLDGAVDPVLEWLEQQGLIEQDGNDWVTITCPWNSAHTTGGTGAGYSPLGRGRRDFSAMRAFHCFHEHCKTHNSTEFLEWVASEGGPEVPTRDPTPELRKNWALSERGNAVTYIGEPTQRFERGTALVIGAFKRMEGRPLTVPRMDGKTAKVNSVDLWLQHDPLMLTGISMEPKSPNTLVRVPGKGLFLNLYQDPGYGEGDFDQENTRPFRKLVDFLLPKPEERTFFLDWLAAKLQDPCFRGPGLLMVARAQGTGRNTLIDAMRGLIGPTNSVAVTLDNLLNDRFNDFLIHPLVSCAELYATRTTNERYRNYERLKHMIDPRATDVLIDRKFQQPVTVRTYASFIFGSNHIDALPLPENDRRIKVLTNPQYPADPDFYAEINRWMWLNQADNEYNKTHLRDTARWLKQRRVNVKELIDPTAAHSDGKQKMFDESRSPLERVVLVLRDCWPTPYVTRAQVMELVHRIHVRYEQGQTSAPVLDNPRLLTRLIGQYLIDPPCGTRITFKGQPFDVDGVEPRMQRVYLWDTHASAEGAAAHDRLMRNFGEDGVVKRVTETSMHRIIELAVDALHEMDVI